MGFMKKIVDSLKLSDDSDYDDYDDYDDYIAAEEEKKRKKEEKKQEKAKEPRTSLKEMIFKKKAPEQNVGYQDDGYAEDPMYAQNAPQMMPQQHTMYMSPRSWPYSSLMRFKLFRSNITRAYSALPSAMSFCRPSAARS